MYLFTLIIIHFLNLILIIILHFLIIIFLLLTIWIELFILNKLINGSVPFFIITNYFKQTFFIFINVLLFYINFIHFQVFQWWCKFFLWLNTLLVFFVLFWIVFFIILLIFILLVLVWFTLLILHFIIIQNLNIIFVFYCKFNY